ncbi:MAG: hypothetical protein V7655_06530 [Aequorivita antarctica]
MNITESEQTASEIQSLIKTYNLCNSITAILRQEIEAETKKQCLIELRKKGFEIIEPNNVELKKMRSELKQIKNRILSLKAQLTPIQQHIYRNRIAWTS